MAKKQIKVKKQKEKPLSNLAVASFVFGLLFLTPVIGGIFGIVAFILGIMALQKIDRYELRGKIFALAGLIMGALGVLGMITFYGVIFGLTRLH